MRFEIPSTDDRDVWAVYLAPMCTATVYVADELNLIGALAEQPATPAELADRLKLDLRGTRAVLPLLASLGFLVQRAGRYQPSDSGRIYMTPGSPFYWGSIWAKRRRRSPDVDFIRSALKPSEASTEIRPWEAPEMSAEAARSVAESMNAHSLPAALGAARNVAFGPVRRLLDVGGGGGCYSIVFAQQHPHLRCTVLDLPAMCKVVKENVVAGEVEGRVDTISLNMFKESWPSGYDAIFLSNVLHDWDDPTSSALIAKAYEALPSGGQILLNEILFDDTGAGPLVAAAFSVQMLGTQGGRQRSFPEFAAMLTQAGFVDPKATTTSVSFSVVSARKP